MGDENQRGRPEPHRVDMSQRLLYTAAIAALTYSLSGLYVSIVRNPVNELDELTVKFERHIDVYDNRIDQVESKLQIMSYRVDECVQKVNR